MQHISISLSVAVTELFPRGEAFEIFRDDTGAVLFYSTDIEPAMVESEMSRLAATYPGLKGRLSYRPCAPFRLSPEPRPEFRDAQFGALS